MNPIARFGLPLALAAAAPTAAAVHLDPHGRGQVLIFPYYTANAGYATLLSLVNDGITPKALKLRFHEGARGRVVFSANLYLAPHDVWTAAVFADAGGTAALVTDDPTCTVPDLRGDASLPSLPDGRRYVRFDVSDYTGAHADDGPAGPERTRDGHVEVVEMATVDGASADALAFSELNPAPPPGLLPRDCGRLVDAWKPAGYWTTNASTDVAAPNGGMYGNTTIVHALKGIVFGIPATALDGFSVRAQHTAPNDRHPNLADAVSDTATGAASAYVPIGTRMVRADYPAARAVDAVSAVLTARTLGGETITRDDGSAVSEWIVAAPTKRFYVDATLGNAALGGPPFCSASPPGDACSTRSTTFLRRDRNMDTMFDFPGYPGAPRILTYDTSVTAMHERNLQVVATPLFGSPNRDYISAFEEGVVSVAWSHRLTPALGGETFVGVPVIGVQATSWFNGNVTPGVLSNYSAAYPLRAAIECRKGAGGC